MFRTHQVVAVLFAAAFSAGQALPQPTGAAWELRALGVPEGERLDTVRGIAGRRPVTLAIVGQGGVSESGLAISLGENATLEYRNGATDPGSSTHDTAAARVILDVTSRLGVQVRLLVYHPGAPSSEVADSMRAAGNEADIVAFFQSFWGEETSLIAEAIRQSEGCLFISPYVEYQSRPTSTCVQAHSAKPWGDGLPHFITAAPVAYKAPGQILTPANGEGDTEVINFLAPSYYASGAGGTCPAGEVTAAVAAYIVAASPEKPPPAEVVAVMRETVTADEAPLADAFGYDANTVAQLTAQIAALALPEEGRRLLDAAGILDLWGIYHRITSGN